MLLLISALSSLPDILDIFQSLSSNTVTKFDKYKFLTVYRV